MFYFVKGPPPLFVEMRVSEVPANGVEQTEVVSAISILTFFVFFIIILIIIPIIISSQRSRADESRIWNFDSYFLFVYFIIILIIIPIISSSQRTQ